MLRSRTVFAAALAAMSATGAQAEGWCGYAAREKATIECGYSTAAECENAIGKGGMCFIDPEFAGNATRTTPPDTAPAIGKTLAAGTS